MKGKRSAFLLLGWVAVAGLLAACQAQLPGWLIPWQSAGPTPAAQSTPGAVAVATPVVQLLGWSASEREDATLREAIALFGANQPTVGFTVTLATAYDTALTTALAADPPPDLLLLDSARVRPLAAAGRLAPLDDAVTATADFLPWLQAGFSLDGVLYCAPREVRTLALVYNRDRFDAAGLPYPTADWTWETLRSAAETLTDEANHLYGLTLAPDFTRWLPFLYAAGGSVTDEAMSAVTINSDAARASMSFYTELVLDGFAAPPADLDSSWAGEAFGKGRAAMAIEGNWIVPYLADAAPTLRYGLVELPVGPQGRATLAFASCYAIPANAPNPALARQLVEFLTAPANLTAMAEASAALPPRLSLLDPWRQRHPEQEPFVASLSSARLWILDARFNTLVTTVNRGLQQAFLGVRSVVDILNEADGVANRAIAP